MSDHEKTGYVVGFACDPVTDTVLLIRKNRPPWQKGLLNGIGGHVEGQETVKQAMVREFHEETGMMLGIWQPMLRMDFPGAYIWFYRAHITTTTMLGACSMTDEKVERWAIGGLLAMPGACIIPNLRWLLPMAAYTADRYEPFMLRATVAEALGPGAAEPS